MSLSQDLTSLADDIALTETLAFAVPLRIGEILRLPEGLRANVLHEWPQGQHVRIKEADAQNGFPAEYTSESQWLASRGDLLQFAKPQEARTAKNRQDAAQAFNFLARGLACAAFMDGGVTFAGLHWCMAPHSNCPNDKDHEEVA
jgi:hypothetical protein